MSIWTIADLHLSFGLKDKEMDVFGEEWIGWTDKIATNWKKKIHDDDLILIPGDISWAKHLDEALPDLEWIDSLPGTKVLLKGNHDYWWSSINKVRKILPPSLHVVQNDVFNWNGVTIGGARMWDTPAFGFNEFIHFRDNKKARELTDREKDADFNEKVYRRELGRLEMSLRQLDPNARLKIAMTHYPPVSADLQDSEVSKMLEAYGVDICVFGHLHSLKPGVKLFGEKNGIPYILCSCDCINFDPICCVKE